MVTGRGVLNSHMVTDPSSEPVRSGEDGMQRMERGGSGWGRKVRREKGGQRGRKGGERRAG